MNICEDCGEIEFDYGDRVQLIANHMVSGQVIGERNWGQEYRVRVVGLLEPIWYERVELEPDPEFFGDPNAAMKPPEGAPEATTDNVVPFTRKVVH